MKRLSWLLVACVLAGCGGEEESRATGKDVADDFNRNMDDAAAVEAQLEAGRQRLEEELEEAEQSRRDP